jgi:hypothetical protein
VILLAGFPNSGTTIAAYILGQHPAVFVSGELTQFPLRQLKPSKVCSCGMPAMRCPFWCEVLERLGDLRHAADAIKMPALYRIICEVSGAAVVVDVAHDLRAVRAARALNGIDLCLVHLSRRPWAVLRSRLTLNRRQGQVQPYTLAYAWRAFRHVWRRQRYEWTLGSCVRAEGPAAMRASYEDLCARPATSLDHIGRIAGLDFSGVVSRLDIGAPLKVPTHMIRGNARLRSEESVRLVPR